MIFLETLLQLPLSCKVQYLQCWSPKNKKKEGVLGAGATPSIPVGEKKGTELLQHNY